MAETKKIALITGASTGIGREFALQLGKSGGYDLILTARRERLLKEVSSEISQAWDLRDSSKKEHPTISRLCFDLGSADERKALINAVDGLGVEVDLLINNAGFGSVGSLITRDIERELEMVEVNCKAVVELSHHFLGEMRRRKKGAVINVCSICSFQPFPYMSTYGATKAFLLSHTLAMHSEAKKDGVRVMALCPGPTHTEFHIAAGLAEEMSFLPRMTAEQVVKEALLALPSDRAIVINGVINLLLTYLAKVLPRRWSAALVARALRSYA